MSQFQSRFVVFNMPVLEFPVTGKIEIDRNYTIELKGYIDIFGNYYDMSLFTKEILQNARKKYDKHKMSQMQKTHESRQDTETMSSMYQ